MSHISKNTFNPFCAVAGTAVAQIAVGTAVGVALDGAISCWCYWADSCTKWMHRVKTDY